MGDDVGPPVESEDELENPRKDGAGVGTLVLSSTYEPETVPSQRRGGGVKHLMYKVLASRAHAPLASRRWGRWHDSEHIDPCICSKEHAINTGRMAVNPNWRTDAASAITPS